MTAYGLVIPTGQRCQEFLPSSRARGTAFMSGGGGGGALLSNFNVAFKSLSYGEGRGEDGELITATISFLRFSAECA